MALANRAVSWGSRTNARTTRMPVICSRRIRFTSSIRFCICRNPGTIRLTMKPTTRNSTGTTTTSSQDRPRSSRIAITMPPTIMIGAAIIIVQVISTSIWTCWTSLVLRVIRLGAPNCWTSRCENEPTRWNRSRRTSRPKAIAVRAPNQTATTAQAICTSEIASMIPPSRMISSVSPCATPLSMMSALRLGR